MLKIAICDDEQVYLRDLRRLLSEYPQSRELGDFDIHTFSKPLDLLEKIRSGVSFDIFLLDIYMPDMTGIALAENLRAHNIDAPIIFLTTSKDHALDAFGVGATQYLLKPFEKESFFAAMGSAMEKAQRERRCTVVLQSDGGLQSVAIREIIYTEARSNYQELHMTDASSIKLRMTSTELYQKLTPFCCFARCGVAYILNLAHTKRIEPKNALMSDGTSIPIPRGIYTALRHTYFEFYGREEG